MRDLVFFNGSPPNFPSDSPFLSIFILFSFLYQTILCPLPIPFLCLHSPTPSFCPCFSSLALPPPYPSLRLILSPHCITSYPSHHQSTISLSLLIILILHHTSPQRLLGNGTFFGSLCIIIIVMFKLQLQW